MIPVQPRKLKFFPVSNPVLGDLYEIERRYSSSGSQGYPCICTSPEPEFTEIRDSNPEPTLISGREVALLSKLRMHVRRNGAEELNIFDNMINRLVSSRFLIGTAVEYQGVRCHVLDCKFEPALMSYMYCLQTGNEIETQDIPESELGSYNDTPEST